MVAGAFRVYQEPANPRDIRFEVCSDQADPIPIEQLNLRDAAQSALIVIGIICPEEVRFREYFQHLLSLSQAGLVGATANPDLAQRALDGLKQDVTAREAGRVKNAYMKRLGYHAMLAVILLGAVWTGLYQSNSTVWPRNLTIFEVGTMLGVWLSFGTRKPILKFEELHILEEDRLEPAVRLIFAGLLAGTIALAFYLKVVTITLGTLTTDTLATNAWAALLFGLLSGVSEKALSTNVSRQAGLLLKD